MVENVLAETIPIARDKKIFFTRLWDACPRVFNNPIILRELISILRKRIAFLYLLLLLVFGSFYVLLIWNEFLIDNPQDLRSIIIRNRFLTLNVIEGGFLMFLVPLFSAVSINIERERKTWDLVRTTPLSLASILFGKFLSSIFFVWILICSLLVFYALMLPLGGIDPSEVVLTFLLYTEMTVIASLIGLFCSICWKRTVTAVSFAYGFVFCYFVVLPFLRYFITFKITGGTSFFFEFLLSPIILYHYYLGQLPWKTSAWIANNAYTIHALAAAGVALFLFCLCVWILSIQIDSESKASRRRYWTGGFLRWLYAKMPKESPLLWQLSRHNTNPIFIKEMRAISGYRRLPSLLSHILLASASVLVISFQTIVYSYDESWIYLPAWTVCLLPFFILPYAAHSFRGEKDQDTWISLITTTIPSRTILRGKATFGFGLLMKRLLAFSIPWMLLSILFSSIGPIDSDFAALYFYYAFTIFTAFGLFLLCLGMYLSIHMKKTTTAYALSFASAAFVNFWFFVLADTPLERELFSFLSSVSPFYLMVMMGYEIETTSMRYYEHLDWAWICILQTGWMLAAALFFYWLTKRQIHRRVD